MNIEMEMLAHACNLSTGETEKEDLEFKVSLDCIMRPCHKQANITIT